MEGGRVTGERQDREGEKKERDGGWLSMTR